MALNVKIESGLLLIADPFLQDPYFRRSVVLLCEHHKEGSLGFILNKTLDMGLNDLISDFPEFDAEVYYGGPVQTDTLHYIHSLGDLIDDSVEVSKGVHWGGDFDQVKFLISSGLLEPGRIRFFVGYSGWSAGQLALELEYGSWIGAGMDANYIFKSPPDKVWSQAMYNKGDAYEIISAMPDYSSWN